MKVCLKPNFEKDLHSGDLNFPGLQGTNLDEILANIETALEGMPFSVSLDSSLDVNTYQDSVNSMISTIIEKLEGKDLPFQLNRSVKSQIRNYLKGKLLPKPLTPVEENIQAVIAGSDLISEEDRRQMRLSLTLREVYGGNDAINAFRQSQFDEEMRIRTIIDVNSRKIIDTLQDLNEGISAYLAELYKIIRDFLKSKGFDTSLMPQSLYRTDSRTGVKNLVRTYTNALQMMYNYILSKKANGTLEQELEDGWANHILGKGGSELYDAVNAYVNLTYFDDILKECFGDYISINQNYDQPITVESDGNGSTNTVFKYVFEKGNANAANHWGMEEHDSLKEMSKFQQILIKSIPIYNYELRSIEYGRMLPKDFVGSFSKLLDVGSQVSVDPEFLAAVSSFHQDTSKKLEVIFRRLFENRSNTTLLKALDDLGLDTNNINFLYSVYVTVFKGKNSWKSVEGDYIRERGMTPRYFLIDTLLGVMDSNVSMNYAQTTYNHDDEQVETSVKARYSANRTKFDIVNNVNSVTIDREGKKEILSKFRIDTKNKKDYTITFNIGGTDVEFTVSPKAKGLLDKDANSNDLTISRLASYASISTASIDSRRRLIAGEGLSNLEQEFMGVLDFIDTMLETHFSRDVDGLREFNLLLRLNRNGLKELFASASRALLVTDIYDKFESAVKPDGTKYSRTELLKYLEDSDVYPDKIQQFSDKKKKGFFIQRFDGYQLNTLRANQRWVDDLARVRAILSGDTSKSVIANLDGDKIPNFGPGYLGARLEQQLTQSNQSGLATSHLLFVGRPTAIKAKVVNTDVITKDGIRKQVKNMTEGELLYDAIVNKFMVPFLDPKNRSMYTLPTTYSDKTKFILYQVSLEALGIGSLTSPNFNQNIEEMIINSIGKAYKEVYSTVLQDYAKIFPEFVANGEVNLDMVQSWMKAHNEAEFISKALQNGVTVYKDVHYRQVQGKKLSINELLYEYANELYSPEKLHERLEFEKLNFINDLLAKRLSFEVDLDEYGELDKARGNEVTRMLVEVLPGSGKSWVRGNKMALAKVKNKRNGKVRYITYGKISLSPDEVFEINPVLNAFFMLDNLIGNNLRYSLTGSEINHKVKALAELDLGKKGAAFYRPVIKQLNPSFDGNITFYDISRALQVYDTVNQIALLESDFELADPDSAVGIGYAIEQLSSSIPQGITLDGIDEQAIAQLRRIYNEQIYKIENGAQNALFKRNVIIPGTMRYYLQGRLNGIRDKMKVAVINDLGANVFNFDGVAAGIDAHDGSAFINPFSSILENFSLQDCEVGTVKKPIQHWYDDRYMSATLLKYAVDTITNQWMRQAEGNQSPTNRKHGIVLRNVFKKMTNVRWHNPDGSWKFGEIDLIGGCEYRTNPKINFLEHIAESSGEIKGLFYRDGITHKKIHDFGRDGNVYYTIEYDVDSMGLAPSNPQKVYHYFQNDGTHVRSAEILTAPDLHSIDSLFELHTALGGIYSESIDGEGNLQYSEASNYAVAQFINNVATLKEGADPEVLTQESYYQPLKQAMIDVLANNSAVKNGAGNMNPTSSFYDDTEFSYIEIGTEGYGIQMDADHTADEGHMTEFSQVISSLDAGGRLHGYVSQIYETLGKLAIDLSEVELQSIETFRETGNISLVYDIVGRTIMNNLSRNRGQAGLANAIIDAIKERFNLNTDHALDEFKIPFSDPNIYSTILSTFVSVINKKSIKRQYPGLGTVMVPGYDISMIYEIDGNTYQFEDLIKMAIEAGYTSTSTDLAQRNREIVQQYLQAEQNKLPIYTSQEIFQPTDNVRISYNSDVSGTGMIEVSLNKIEDYYLFKDDIVAFLSGKGIVNPTNISFLKNITVPRNLAPVRISWEYDDETGHHFMNIFDHWAIKSSYNDKRDVKAIQKAFDDLEKGIYYRSPEDTVGVKIYSFDEKGNRQNRASNKAAEIIMSNLYKTKFGLRNGDSMADVLKQGVDYFKRPVTPIMSDSYDLVYTKQDNKSLYITFKPLHHNDENFDSTKRPWRNKIKREFEYPPEYTGERTIIHRVFTTTNDNIILFEVGREVLRKDVQYDSDKKKFVDKNGKVLANQQSFSRYGEDQVLEYVEFISHNQVTEVGLKTQKYDLYNINRDAIKKVFARVDYTEEQLTRTDKKTGETYTITADLKFDEEVNGFISRLLADIYHTRDFNGMLVNQEVTLASAYVLLHTLYGLGEQLKFDSELSSYIKEGLLNIVNSGKAEDGVVKYSNRMRTRLLNEYNEKLAKKQYTSFLKSLEFTVSRIPAQTLQSFMQMRNVGFTGTTTNQCFVSHWQTW